MEAGTSLGLRPSRRVPGGPGPVPRPVCRLLGGPRFGPVGPQRSRARGHCRRACPPTAPAEGGGAGPTKARRAPDAFVVARQFCLRFGSELVGLNAMGHSSVLARAPRGRGNPAGPRRPRERCGRYAQRKVPARHASSWLIGSATGARTRFGGSASAPCKARRRGSFPRAFGKQLPMSRPPPLRGVHPPCTVVWAEVADIPGRVVSRCPGDGAAPACSGESHAGGAASQVKLGAMRLGLPRAAEWGTHCFRRGRGDEILREGAADGARRCRRRSFCCGGGAAALFAQGGWRSVAAFAYASAKTTGEMLAAEHAVEHSDSSEGEAAA